jgi:hypothetical protein
MLKDQFIRHLQHLKPVTVNIAAICDLDAQTYYPKIVFSSDRLVSAGVQYEGGEPKIKQLTEYCYVMTSSNDSLTSDLILETIKDKIKSAKNQMRIRDIVELLSEECVNFKRLRIEREVLSKYNLTSTNLNAPSETIINDAMKEVNDYEYPLECDFIVLGFDKETEPHLYKVNQKGDYRLCDSLGFVTSGSGGSLAFLEMTKYSYSRQEGMVTAIPRVYFAKKVSERAEGVGRYTDLYIMYPRIADNGKVTYSVYEISATTLMNDLNKTFTEIQDNEGKKLAEISDEIYKMFSGQQKQDEAKKE